MLDQRESERDKRHIDGYTHVSTVCRQFAPEMDRIGSDIWRLFRQDENFDFAEGLWDPTFIPTG
jgi:hypothetical protein